MRSSQIHPTRLFRHKRIKTEIEREQQRLRWERLSGLLMVYVIVAVDMLGFSIVIPILPFFSLSFGASATLVGLVSTIFNVTSFISTIFMGRLSDRFGRKPTLLFTLFTSAVGSIAAGFATNIGMLLAFRAVGGLGGGSPSIAQAFIADIATPNERATFMSLLGAVISAAFVFGPIMGSAFAQFGNSVPLWVAGVLSAMAFIFSWFYLKETHSTKAILEVIQPNSNDKEDNISHSASVAEKPEKDGEAKTDVEPKTELLAQNQDEGEEEESPESDSLGVEQEIAKAQEVVAQEEAHHEESQAKDAPTNWPRVILICVNTFFYDFVFSAFSTVFSLYCSDIFHLSSAQIGFFF